jgi:hypothetical protein
MIANMRSPETSVKVRIPIHPKDRTGRFWLMLAGNAAQAGLPETGAGISQFHRACPDASFQIIACNGVSQQTTTSAGIGNSRSGPYTIPLGLDCIAGMWAGSSLEMYPQLHMLLTSCCSSFATPPGARNP